ncbi:EF-hand domain-containing protein [Phenylobacterium sp.]|uniref:EF-hand domain-containing protein n=1 Tax=Phenylobacterium sp. TaxID=1871053 RepID=UPI0030F487AC
MHRFLIVAAALSIAGSAQAQMGPPNPDANRDGKVTWDEYRSVQSGAMLDRLDSNKDGRITKAESKPMEDMAARFGGAKATARIAEMWSKGDANRDGALSRAELEAMSRRRFDAGDTNHDGWLSKGELATMRQNRGRDG